MKLQALLEAVASLAAIHERGLDHVDPAGAHREGITAVMQAAVEHHTEVEQRMRAIEENGMPAEAADRLAAAEAKVVSLAAAVESLQAEAADLRSQLSSLLPLQTSTAAGTQGQAPAGSAPQA